MIGDSNSKKLTTLKIPGQTRDHYSLSYKMSCATQLSDSSKLSDNYAPK